MFLVLGWVWSISMCSWGYYYWKTNMGFNKENQMLLKSLSFPFFLPPFLSLSLPLSLPSLPFFFLPSCCIFVNLMDLRKFCCSGVRIPGSTTIWSNFLELLFFLKWELVSCPAPETVVRASTWVTVELPMEEKQLAL